MELKSEKQELCERCQEELVEDSVTPCSSYQEEPHHWYRLLDECLVLKSNLKKVLFRGHVQIEFERMEVEGRGVELVVEIEEVK